MSAEENKSILRRTIEEANKGNYDAVWDIMAPDCVFLDETGTTYSKPQYKQRLDMLLSAMPDYHLVIEDLFAEEDKVAVRYTESGTMKGDLFGMAATGKKFSTPAIEIWRFENGKLKEMWMARDTLTQGVQMGIFPSPE